MKKILSYFLAVVILITSLPFSFSFATPASPVAGYAIKYLAYIFSLLGFKLYDSTLGKSFLPDFVSTVSSEQYDDIVDYLDSYDSFDNVEIRKKDIDMVYDIYRSIYHTASALTDSIILNDYSVNFDVLKDIPLSNGLVGQFNKNRFYYRDYVDDVNWVSRLESYVFGESAQKSIILPFANSIVSFLFSEINLENLKKVNAPFTYEYIYEQSSYLQREKVYTKYMVRVFRRILKDGVLTDFLIDEKYDFLGKPFSGTDYYVYINGTTLNGIPCFYVRYYEKNTKYSQGMKNMYIPYAIYKWKFINYQEAMHEVEVLWDNSYIVNRLKELFSAGKKIFADLTKAIIVLQGSITSDSDNYDRANEKLKSTTAGIESGILSGVMQGLIIRSNFKAGTALKYGINGMTVDTTYDSIHGGLGSTALEGLQDGVDNNTSVLTGLSNGVLSLQKILNKANSIALSQSLALEAIRNSNFNNHNHDFKSPKNLNFLDKFPFCLPKDVHLLLSVFSSDSKQPIFEVNILGNVILLDFTRFEVLANIVRITVTITFIFSLIVLTRKVVQ